MPDEDTALQQPGVIKTAGTALPDHLGDGRGGDLRVIRRGGIAFRRIGIQVFQIRHIDLYQPLQKAQCFRLFVSGTVPDNRNAELQSVQCFGDHAGKVRRCNKLNIMDALIPQAQHQRAKLGNGKNSSDTFPADFTVLTENTAEIAAGEENGSGTARPADAGLFSVVRRGADDTRQHGTDTDTAAGTSGTLRLTGPGAIAAYLLHRYLRMRKDSHAWAK